MYINKDSYKIAKYWLAYNYHEGQNSDLYEYLSDCDYEPSPLTRGILDEDECVIAYYFDLLDKYGYEREFELYLRHQGSVQDLQDHRGILFVVDSDGNDFWDEVNASTNYPKTVLDALVEDYELVNEQLQSIVEDSENYDYLFIEVTI